VDHDPSLPLWQVLVIVAIQLLGYYIFRSSNSQKDAFRTNPDGLEVSLSLVCCFELGLPAVRSSPPFFSDFSPFFSFHLFPSDVLTCSL